MAADDEPAGSRFAHEPDPTEAEDREAVTVTDADIEEAAAIWRAHAPFSLRNLLDAHADGNEEAGSQGS